MGGHKHFPVFAVLFLALTACQTQSGQAVQSAFGKRMDRLTQSLRPRDHVADASKGFHRAWTTAGRLWNTEKRRTRSLPSSLRHHGGRLREDMAKLTQRSGKTLRYLIDHDRRALGDLTRLDSGLVARLKPERMMIDLRNAVRSVPNTLGLDRYILPGPGDPDRSTDPLKTTRSETWLERMLMRLKP